MHKVVLKFSVHAEYLQLLLLKSRAKIMKASNYSFYAYIYSKQLKLSDLYCKICNWFLFTDEKAENGSDSSKRDRLLPDLCVICLEQEYNAVFVP